MSRFIRAYTDDPEWLFCWAMNAFNPPEHRKWTYPIDLRDIALENHYSPWIVK